MKLKAQTITDAYQEWLKEEIKSTTKNIFEFGKFIFGVSIGSIGFLTAIENFTSVTPDFYYIFSIILLIFTSFIAIVIVLPKTITINAETDLQELLSKMVSKSQRIIWMWLFIWLIALVLGLVGVFIK